MKIKPNCKYWKTWVYQSEYVLMTVATVLNVNLLNTYGSALKHCKQNMVLYILLFGENINCCTEFAILAIK